MRRLLLLLLIFFCASQYSSAQKQKSAFFYSTRSWTAPRWYAIGVLRESFIEWRSSRGISRQPIKASCRFDQRKFDYERDSNHRDFEVLRSGKIILVELNPELHTETFTLKLRDNSDCRTRFELSYEFAMPKSKVKPFVFLNPITTTYEGVDYVIYVPPGNEKSDIQMDIQLGYWQVNLSSVSAGGSNSLALTPVFIARGEWLPDYMRKGLGFSFALEQNLATFGTGPDQSLSFSELNGGIFYEMILPWADGFQTRLSARIWQHQADDGKLVRSVGSNNGLMYFPVASLMGNLYFGGSWFLGYELGWGLKNQILSSADQEMFEFGGRAGYRLTSNMLWVVEGGGLDVLEEPRRARAMRLVLVKSGSTCSILAFV